LILINDYSYRKEFGLSQRDFEEEPLDVYYANNEIMSVISDIKRTETKRMEKKAKR